MEIPNGSTWVELEDGNKAFIRNMDEEWIRIMMGGIYKDQRFQATTFSNNIEDGRRVYREIERVRFITVKEIKRILSVI